ncbi:hypothetical protein ACTFIZ_007778 [Dictyostelium cf. discoideum]
MESLYSSLKTGKFCNEEYINIWMHIKRKHSSELEDEKYHKNLENDFGYCDDSSNHDNLNENIYQGNNEDSEKEDFNSDIEYLDIENKDNDETEEENNLEISFEEVKSYKEDLNKSSLENILGGIKNRFKIIDNKTNQNQKIFTSIETLVSQFKRTVKYKYPVEPIKYELEFNNKQGVPFKKTICYNEILECIVSLIKIPHIRNNLKLETLFLDTNNEEYFIFPLACIKNDHEVKLTDQINFQKVLDIIFKNFVDFLNSNSYFIVNDEKYVIKLNKIYGDLPGLSLFLNIAFFSKQIAKQLYEEEDPIKKDQYGLKDPQDIFQTIQKCFLHNDLLGMVKREVTEVFDSLNKKSKIYAKELFSSLPIINGVNLRGFDLKFFVGKEYRILLEIFSIVLSEITEAIPSPDFLKSYLHVIFLHEEYLKLLLCSNEYFTTEKEKIEAMYIKHLIFEHRKEYLKIRKNVLEKRYRRRCKRNNGTLDLNSLDKFKEKGLMILHLGIHYIEDLEMNKNPINHTGQDMEASIRDYKRIETTKSNNKYGYSIIKSSNLRILNRINSKIKKQITERIEIEDFDISIVSSIKFRDQVYTSGNYISLDYEFSTGPNKIKSINYSIINEIVEIKYPNKKEVLLLVDFSWINEFHTNIFRVIYDIDINKTIENSSIVTLYSLNNLVYRWDINKKIYGSAFTIIDLYRPKIFTFPNSDPIDLKSKVNKIKYFNTDSNSTESFEVGYRSLYQCTNNSVRKKFSDHDARENDIENSENEACIDTTDSEGGI